MRTAFVDGLCELAGRDERVMLLTADLGWSVLERFAQRFPDRFVNVGVAEQNMLGIATGLAREGLVPFAYSIATFATMRCFEQIRNGPVLHRLPIRIVGTGGGFAYGNAGPTHHAIEDLSIARTLPGLAVVAPADGAQTRTVLQRSRRHAGPMYLRIDKSDQPDIAALDGRFAFDRPALVRPGADVLLLTTGSIVHETLRAADEIETHGISAAVAHFAHLPFRGGAPLVRLLRRYREIVTIEEGSLAGGLGSLAAETIAEERLAVGLTRLGVESLTHGSGSRPYLLERHGLDTASIARRVVTLLGRRVAA
jgi:transketolase